MDEQKKRKKKNKKISQFSSINILIFSTFPYQPRNIKTRQVAVDILVEFLSYYRQENVAKKEKMENIHPYVIHQRSSVGRKETTNIKWIK